uniref:Uncharacterized protein n=1 Tax=Prolemur simus TaxID=1328070 RepID=A0A8C8YM02_PROSS
LNLLVKYLVESAIGAPHFHHQLLHLLDSPARAGSPPPRGGLQALEAQPPPPPPPPPPRCRTGPGARACARVGRARAPRRAGRREGRRPVPLSRVAWRGPEGTFVLRCKWRCGKGPPLEINLIRLYGFNLARIGGGYLVWFFQSSTEHD